MGGSGACLITSGGLRLGKEEGEGGGKEESGGKGFIDTNRDVT